MISAMHLNRFDGAGFVRELIETMKQRDTKKMNYSDGEYEIFCKKLICYKIADFRIPLSSGVLDMSASFSYNIRNKTEALTFDKYMSATLSKLANISLHIVNALRMYHKTAVIFALIKI